MKLVNINQLINDMVSQNHIQSAHVRTIHRVRKMRRLYKRARK